jgi:uncharacterized membrane protein (DUF4010 family)
VNDSFQTLGIALGLGLLVGLQRERAASVLAGFRTFPLITLFGTICAWLAVQHGGWVIGAGLLALAAAIVAGNSLRTRQTDTDPGITTEAAMLLMFGVGAYLPGGDRPLAMVIAAATAVLLHLKPQLHDLAKRIGDHDFRAIMQFVLIALVILPIVPDATFGPFNALNPHRIWWMVVLITGISLSGYLLHKWLGDRSGAMVAGLLGGLISSTATSVTHSRLTRGRPEGAPLAAVVILLASAVVFARLMVLVAAADPEHLLKYVPPFASLLVVLLGFAAWHGLRNRDEQAVLPPPSNPTELRSALIFTAIYATVLLGVAAARSWYGTRGLLLVATVSGLTDMDAITLSTAQLSRQGTITVGESTRAIVVASVSNLAFKAAVVGTLGDRQLLWKIAPAFGAAAAAGALWVVLR